VKVHSATAKKDSISSGKDRKREALTLARPKTKNPNLKPKAQAQTVSLMLYGYVGWRWLYMKVYWGLLTSTNSSSRTGTMTWS
jgi:hypothetical protein